MTAPLNLSERYRVRVDRIGSEGAPVIVVDDFLCDAERLVEVAAAESFAPVTHRAYPGIRAAAPPQYATALHHFLRDLICSTFGFTGSDVIAGESSFSIVTSAPGNLHVRQRLPHFDSPDTQLIALLHYLCPEALGGTSFYRHRATGFESITADRLARFDQIVDSELAGAEPVGYINGDSAHYQRIASYSAAFNRLIVYRSATLHSGDIPRDFPGDANPRSGRLTVNTFFMFRPPQSAPPRNYV